MAISPDLRKRVLDAYENKEGSIRTLAKRFAVDPKSIQNWLNQWRKTGEFKARFNGGRYPGVRGEGKALLMRLVQEKPDRTLQELVGLYNEQKPAELPTVQKSAMDRALKRMGLTRKKRQSMLRNARASV